MTLILHHIGIVVADLEAGAQRIDSMIPGLIWSRPMIDPLQEVAVRFAGHAGLPLPLYEVIAATTETSPVRRVMQQGRDVLNHVAYLCGDLAAERERLRAQGCMPLGAPKPGAVYEGAAVQFFYTPIGCLMELIEHAGPVLPLDAALT